jgi:ATP-dependent DNA helicase RecG
MDEDMVIALAKEQGAFTKKDVEKALGVSQTTCGQLLKQMIEKGQIIQEGRSRNTYYRLTE